METRSVRAISAQLDLLLNPPTDDNTVLQGDTLRKATQNIKVCSRNFIKLIESAFAFTDQATFTTLIQDLAGPNFEFHYAENTDFIRDIFNDHNSSYYNACSNDKFLRTYKPVTLSKLKERLMTSDINAMRKFEESYIKTLYNKSADVQFGVPPSFIDVQPRRNNHGKLTCPPPLLPYFVIGYSNVPPDDCAKTIEHMCAQEDLQDYAETKKIFAQGDWMYTDFTTSGLHLSKMSSPVPTDLIARMVQVPEQRRRVVSCMLVQCRSDLTSAQLHQMIALFIKQADNDDELIEGDLDGLLWQMFFTIQDEHNQQLHYPVHVAKVDQDTVFYVSADANSFALTQGTSVYGMFAYGPLMFCQMRLLQITVRSKQAQKFARCIFGQAQTPGDNGDLFNGSEEIKFTASKSSVVQELLRQDLYSLYGPHTQPPATIGWHNRPLPQRSLMRTQITEIGPGPRVEDGFGDNDPSALSYETYGYAEERFPVSPHLQQIVNTITVVWHYIKFWYEGEDYTVVMRHLLPDGEDDAIYPEFLTDIGTQIEEQNVDWKVSLSDNISDHILPAFEQRYPDDSHHIQAAVTILEMKILEKDSLRNAINATLIHLVSRLILDVAPDADPAHITAAVMRDFVRYTIDLNTYIDDGNFTANDQNVRFLYQLGNVLFHRGRIQAPQNIQIFSNYFRQGANLSLQLIYGAIGAQLDRQVQNPDYNPHNEDGTLNFESIVLGWLSIR